MKSVLTTLFLVAITALNAQNIDKKTQPKEVVLQLFVATDQTQWEIVKNCFAKEVLLDYSSMGNPVATLTPKQITDAWKTILPGFTATHHQIGNIQETIDKNKAEVFAYGTATHYLEDENGSVWTVVGTYNFTLIKEGKLWKINEMKFNFKYQDGNLSLPQKSKNTENKNSSEISKSKKQETMKKINFKSEGLNLVGNLYYPENYDANKTYPAVVVSGSWTTIKEQMAGLYAQKLAKEGFITLAFDFRNFGESEGEPRFFESPQLKKEDIKNAVSYLSNLNEVDSEKIGAFGVCAGAMYTLMASAEDDRIKSVSTVASWLHDAEAVKLFYGGEEGVQTKIKAGQEAKKKYAETGEVVYIPSISETDENAAMYGPYDYYLNPERGAVKEWSSDKFAVASWEDWLTANPMPYAKRLNKPVLMVHSDGAVLPNYTKKFFNDIATTNKKFHWMETELESPYHQFNFYDQDAEVNEAVIEVSNWFREKM